jgi:hypothetical protein
MSREGYIPPEFDPAAFQQVPLAAIGEVVLHPEMSITGVGGFLIKKPYPL